MTSKPHVPTTPAERKALPICTGVLDYFPDALLAVSEVSRLGNAQHNPGEPLHWAKEKSTDEPDALLRHLIDRGKYDADGVRHSAKVAWRALALLQREIDAEQAESNHERIYASCVACRRGYHSKLAYESHCRYFHPNDPETKRIEAGIPFTKSEPQISMEHDAIATALDAKSETPPCGNCHRRSCSFCNENQCSTPGPRRHQ